VDELDAAGGDYEVNLSAWLTGSYWVRLTDPIELSPSKQQLLDCSMHISDVDWPHAVKELRSGTARQTLDRRQGMLL
jgi:hypothetical protein